MSESSEVRPLAARVHALEEWIAHKPHCAVMGSEFRQPWRDGDEDACNCGLWTWYAREYVNAVLSEPEATKGER